MEGIRALIFTTEDSDARQFRTRFFRGDQTSRFKAGGSYSLSSSSIAEFARLSWWMAKIASTSREDSVWHISALPNTWRDPLKFLTQRFGAILMAPRIDSPGATVGIAEGRWRELPRWALEADRPFTGSTHPTVIMVGDTLSGRAVTPWPFHMPNGSSEWLHIAVGLRRGVAFVNSSDLGLNDTFDLLCEESLRAQNAPAHIIALGKDARERLYSHGVAPSCTIVHPSWARRFRHSRISEYWAAVTLAMSKGEVAAGWGVK